MTIASSIMEKRKVAATHQAYADEIDIAMLHTPDGAKLNAMAKMRDEHLNKRDKTLEDLEALKQLRSINKSFSAMNKELFG